VCIECRAEWDSMHPSRPHRPVSGLLYLFCGFLFFAVYCCHFLFLFVTSTIVLLTCVLDDRITNSLSSRMVLFIITCCRAEHVELHNRNSEDFMCVHKHDKRRVHEVSGNIRRKDLHPVIAI
jgi:hypothetical protein